MGGNDERRNEEEEEEEGNDWSRESLTRLVYQFLRFLNIRDEFQKDNQRSLSTSYYRRYLL